MPRELRHWKADVLRHVRALRLAPQREAEIVEEVAQDLEQRFHELLQEGIDEERAVQAVLQQLADGQLLTANLERVERAAARRRFRADPPTSFLFGGCWQDVRYGVRSLTSRPVLTLAAVLTLALGIGSNAAIFSVINAVLVRPLPFPGSDRLVALYSRFLPATGMDFPFFALSGPEFADIRDRVDAFEHIAAYSFNSRNLVREDGEAERVLTMRVTAGFFDVLGVAPVRGRTFTEEEAQRRDGCLAILGHDPSGAVRDPVGSTIRLDDAPCEVIGAMPAGFGFRDDRVKVWTPLAIDAEETPINRHSHGLAAIARLRNGVTAEQADAQLQSLWGYWSEKYPDMYAKGHFAVARPLHEDIVGSQRDALILLGGAVLFVLLIVCVNLAAVLVSTGESRRREFAVRHALGANRWRLVRQFIVEAMVLATVGGIVGLLLANGLLAGLLALYPQRLPVWQPITIDYSALLYTFALVVVVGLLVGIAPALNATGRRMQGSLSVDLRTATASRRAVAARAGLVISQLALSVILLAGALLLIRSYQRLQQVDLGIEPDGVLTFSLFIPPARQPDPGAARRTLAAIETRLAATPGIEVAGAVSSLPLASGGPPDAFVIEGRPQPAPGAPTWSARYLMVTPRLFRALGIPLQRGRLLDDSDAPGRPFVAVINETAARLYWPGSDPIGSTIRYYPQETSPSIRIVGIVRDVRSLGASQPAPPAVYVPFDQAPRPPYEGRNMTFVARVQGDPTLAIASARAAVASIDAGLPLANVRPMSEIVSATVGQPRFTTLVMSFFAGLAFFLAALGLYGVLAYSVEQRIREIGVRVALGADKREIYRLIIGKGLALALIGILIGVPGALVLTRLMRGVLAGVASTDPITYGAVSVMLMISALLASYLPARRAVRVDPLVALRTE